MSELSDELQRLCLLCGQTNTALAQRAGIDRATLVHILSGRRSPTANNLEGVLRALQATPAQRNRVKEIYNRQSIDPGLRSQRESVAKMLGQIFEVQENMLSPTLFDTAFGQNQFEEKDYVLLEGAGEMQNALLYLLHSYCTAEQTEPIMLPPGLTSRHLRIMAQMLMHLPGSGQIWHLSTFLKSTPGRQEATHNLDIFADAMPIAYLSNIKYEARFAYTANDEPLPGALFNEYILFPDVLFLINRTGRGGCIVRNREMVQAARHCFWEDYQSSYDYLNVSMSVVDEREGRLEMNAEMDQEKHHTWNLRHEAQVVSCLNEEMFAENAAISAAQEPALYKRMFERMQEIAALPMDCYFTEEGLREFMCTGTAPEIPQCLYKPLTPQRRLQVLDRLIERIETDECADRILDSRYILPPEGFYLTAAEGHSVNFYQQHNAAGGVECGWCKFTEPSTAEAIYDFLKNITQTGYAFDKEETLRLMYHMRKQFAEK